MTVTEKIYQEDEDDFLKAVFEEEQWNLNRVEWYSYKVRATLEDLQEDLKNLELHLSKIKKTY